MANLSNINGKFVVEQTTGYVGVGTTDPNYPIEVLNASAEIALNASGASIYRLRSDSTDSFRINKNGVGDRLVIAGNGNATFAGTVKTQNTSANAYPYFSIEASAKEYHIGVGGASAVAGYANNLYFYDNTAAAIRMLIDTNGNVGIGVTPSLWEIISDSNALQFYGSYIYNYRDTNLILGNNAYYDGTWKYYKSSIGATKFNSGNGAFDFAVSSSGTANNAITWIEALKIDSSGHVGIRTTPQTTLADFCTIEIGNIGMIMSEKADSQYNSMFVSSNAYYASGWKRKTATVDGSTYMSMYLGGIRFGTAPQGAANSAITWTNQLVIANGGNVGIGRDSPDAKLHIYGSASLTEMYLGEDAAADKAGILKYTQGDGSGTGVITLSHWGNNSLTEGLAVKYGGNVGIGTTSPQAPLQVNANIYSIIRLGADYNYSANREWQFRTNTFGTIGWGGIALQQSTAQQGNTFATKFGIDINGNVGIGTTTPDFALDIEAISSGVQLQMGRTSTNVGSAWMGASGSGLAVGVGAYGAGNSVTDPNGFLIDASGNLSTRRRIQAKTDTGVGVSVTRNLFVAHGGSGFDYTFDPVALFGAALGGGKLLLEVTGWPSRLNCGYIVWRNDGNGSGLIGTGVVSYVQTAVQSAGNVAVSLPSTSTNEIKITFTGWHTNDHGWSCYIKNDF